MKEGSSILDYVFKINYQDGTSFEINTNNYQTK